jgi:hypothetical protein
MHQACITDMSGGARREYNTRRRTAPDGRKQASQRAAERWDQEREAKRKPYSGRKRQRIRQAKRQRTRKKRQRAQRRSGRRAAAWHYRGHGSEPCHAAGISAHSCRTTKALPRCSALAAAGLLLRRPLLLSLLASDGPGHRTGGIWCGDRPSGRAGRGCSCR